MKVYWSWKTTLKKSARIRRAEAYLIDVDSLDEEKLSLTTAGFYTATHCFYDKHGYTKTAFQIKVVPGTQANLVDSVTLRFAVPVTKIFVHLNYNMKTEASDICNLKTTLINSWTKSM